MSVFYRLYKNNRENIGKKDKWYARTVNVDTIDLKGLASIMQNNCTVKYSDILAVLSELVETMRYQLQSSKKVKIDGFGTFKIVIHSKPANTPEEFNANTNIHKMMVVFMPESHVDANKHRVRNLLQSCKVQELPINLVVKDKNKKNVPNVGGGEHNTNGNNTGGNNTGGEHNTADTGNTPDTNN